MRHLKPGLTLVIAGLAVLLSACGGGGGGGGNGGTQNQSPVANAGTAQTVTAGATVTLNGALSSDADGSIASYAWTQTVGGAVTLSSATAAQPTFVAPAVANATTLTFSLVVTDNRGTASTASTVNVTVNPAVNVAPVANAGTAQTVTSGSTVTLNGTASADADGTIASYAWTQVGTPAVTLSSATAAQPTFTAPTVATATTLTFSLVVTDNRGAASAAATVSITVSPVANTPPTANAGAAQSVPSGQLVSLNGSGSSDPDGTIATYAWSQTAGTAVTLTGASTAGPSFTAPTVTTSTVLTFSLVVTDNSGANSAASTVNVTVNPTGTGNVTITGKIRYARPPFNTSFPFGLNYAAATFEPARGVVVRALNAGVETVIATAMADQNGDYSLQVPGSTSIQIRPVAWLLRDSGQPLPRYDIRVQDGVAGTPYSYTDAAFNSGSGTTRNVDIPLNINAAGTATGPRASGPFAALDTTYQGMQLILGAAPQTNFPALIIDWGTQSSGTFFSSASPQRIALLANLATDTDEFDEHVVAHEFGHYIEQNFSRADNIGGSHGLGDKLDIRVAFGEGFGYAFAAIVLNDPDARDSYADNGTLRSSGFNIEDNPPAPSDPTGSWASESSVWSILYDLYDGGAEAGDQVALGFTPIWNVLTGPQRTTPAFTSVFSFMTSLKAAQPADDANMNTLLAAQNIVAAGMDIWGSTETNLPAGTNSVPSAAALPLYTVATVNGGPVVMRTVNDAGTGNKLGNHRYVRFNNASQRNVTITLATSNPNASPDPDFLVWSGLSFIGASTSAPPGPEVRTFTNLPAGNYVIDAYDCANGCNPAEGTAGDYDLTVTITSP
jgi:PKD domain